MKTLIVAFLVAITLSVFQGIAVDVPSNGSHVVATNVSTGGTLQITEAPVYVLLDIYTHVSGLELVTASNISQLGSSVVVLPDSDGGGNLLRQIEKALLDQRGILITRLDEKRASVTYNDALKVTPIQDKLTSPTLKIPLEKPSSSSRHLTEAQALALAEPMLPLPAGESYHVNFKSGTWEVFTTPDGVPVRAAKVVLVQDIDGKTQVVYRF